MNIVLRLLFLSLFVSFCATAQTTCTGTWGYPIVNQTFGQGNDTASWYGPLNTYAPGATTSTIFFGPRIPAGGVLGANASSLRKTTANAGYDPKAWITRQDHTGDRNGLMLVINAPSSAATVFFEYKMENLCANTQLRLSVWMININSALLPLQAGYQHSNVTLQAVDFATNALLGEVASGDLPTDSLWHEYSVEFNNGGSSAVVFRLINNSVGSGFGNDLALDDIRVQPCVPPSQIMPKTDTTVCRLGIFKLKAKVVANPYTQPGYQWQISKDTGRTWENEGAASTSTDYVFDAARVVPGIYWLRFLAGNLNTIANTNCIAISDTAIIWVSGVPDQWIHSTTAIAAPCWTSDYILKADNSGVQYLWDDSSTLNERRITEAGTYWVNYYEQPCTRHTDTFKVSFPDAPLPGFEVAASCKNGANGSVFPLQDPTNPHTYHFVWCNARGDTLSIADDLESQPAGQYKVHISSGTCDTIVFVVVPEEYYPVAFTADTLVCVGASQIFNNSSDGYYKGFLWLFGDGLSSELLQPAHGYTQSGRYEVMLIGSGLKCVDTFIRSITVDAEGNSIFVTDRDTVCLGETIQFYPRTDPNATIGLDWALGDGTENTTLKEQMVAHAYSSSGLLPVSLTVHFRACPDQLFIDTVYVAALPEVDLGIDTALCLGTEGITLLNHAIHAQGSCHYLWSTGDTTAAIPVRHHGIYTLGMINEYGCAGTESVTVAKDCYGDIPNAFTPNGDGNNDYFFPRQLLTRGGAHFKMQVFNRWGQLVFETTAINGRGWDGRLKDQQQPEGAYVYRIEMSFDKSSPEIYTGTVTLLR